MSEGKNTALGRPVQIGYSHVVPNQHRPAPTQSPLTIMKLTSPIVRALRLSALLVLASGLALWAGSGARLGWTQTSVITMQREEITGIDFPVRHNAFVAGVEIPLLAALVAAAAAALSLVAQRRSVPIKA